MDPGDLVRLWSTAGFVYAFRPLDAGDVGRVTVGAAASRKETIRAGTLALYVGPNPKESVRLGQPMVDIVVGEKSYSIDLRFLDAVHA